MRVLHLLAPGGGSGDERVAACVRVIEGTQREGLAHHDVLLIGSEADEARAWAMGVHTTDRIVLARRAGGLGVAARALKRWIESRGSVENDAGFDLVQCWCLETAALARRSVLGAPMSVTLVDVEHAQTRELCGVSQAVFSVLDESHVREAARVLCACGALADFGPSSRVRVLDLPRHSAIGCVAESMNEREVQREALKRDWFGVEAGVRVVAYATADADRAEATFFAFTLGLVRVSGVACAGVMARGLPHARRAAKFVRDHGRTWGLCETELGMRNVLECADVCVFDDCGTGAMAGPIMREWCRHRGVRLIVATDRAGLNGPVAEGVTISPRRPASVVKAILDLLSGAVAGGGADATREGVCTHGALWSEMLNARDERLLPALGGRETGTFAQAGSVNG